MSRPGNVMMIVGYGNFTHGADDRGDMLLVVRAKRHERDHKLDEVICEPRASVQLMCFPILHGCHEPIVSNAPKADLERRPAQISSARPTIRGDEVGPVSVRRSLGAVYIGHSVRG
jgi:hypothetical protein